MQENVDKTSIELPEFKEFTHKSEISKGKIKSISLNIEDLKTFIGKNRKQAIITLVERFSKKCFVRRFLPEKQISQKKQQ